MKTKGQACLKSSRLVSRDRENRVSVQGLGRERARPGQLRQLPGTQARRLENKIRIRGPGPRPGQPGARIRSRVLGKPREPMQSATFWSGAPYMAGVDLGSQADQFAESQTHPRVEQRFEEKLEL